MRTFQIIAFIFSIVFAVWFILFSTSDGRISYAEFLPVGMIYSFFMIAFCAVSVFGGRPSKGKDDNWV